MPDTISPPAPDLSVVIVNWNTRELLRGCLDSLPVGLDAAHTAEVWVVDNASGDESASMVARNYPHVRLIANDENVGFARANNQAIRQSAGRHVLLLNSDTSVKAGALSAMVRFLDDRPEIGVVGCGLENADGSTQRSAWNHYPSLSTLAAEAFYLWRIPGLRRWVLGHEQSLTNPTQPIAVKHLLGACMMLRRPVLEAVGLMDEGYFMYLEETEWCRRIDAAGWPIFYLPTARITHFGQQSSGLSPDKANADWCRSLCRYFRNQYPPTLLRLGLLKAIISAASLNRFLLHWTRSVLGRSRKPRPSLSGSLRALRALASS
jgi:N-acetylglucosaminyl-diphospho-decaprenol L-rhamnosyltransferase